MSAGDVPLDVGEENGNPWTPLKDLSAVIDAAVLRHQPGLQVRNSILLLKNELQCVLLSQFYKANVIL
jgi:hypothetical protein